MLVIHRGETANKTLHLCSFQNWPFQLMSLNRAHVTGIRKSLNEKQLEEREENVVEMTYKSCGRLMLCPSHKHVGSGTRTCQQSLLV